ncbi:uncharacterized protein [Musca autumnalis]|uniref:uncharacterized protein n=1 Tax=Musca autumnalis TaxID=221902 RepID=UPI003CF70DA2
MILPTYYMQFRFKRIIVNEHFETAIYNVNKLILAEFYISLRYNSPVHNYDNSFPRFPLKHFRIGFHDEVMSGDFSFQINTWLCIWIDFSHNIRFKIPQLAELLNIATG